MESDKEDLFQFLDRWDDDVNPPKQRKVKERVDVLLLTLAEFKERFRLSPTQAECLLLRIGSEIAPMNGRYYALNAKQRLCAALRFFASNNEYYNVGDNLGEVIVFYLMLSIGVSMLYLCDYTHDDT